MKEHKIGLVFDGGGAKGAYQIDVWKALKELGLDEYVTDVAGTSVGGLNAALFVKGNYEEAERIWSEEVSTINPMEIQIGVQKLIDKYLSDMSFFEQRDMNCFITACNLKDKEIGKTLLLTSDSQHIRKYVAKKAEYFNMRFIDKKSRKNLLEKATMRADVLLATSALPILCRPVKIDGNVYQDGGMVDNSPVLPLSVGTRCDTVIVIHLGCEENIHKEYFPNQSILEIEPSQNLGGLFSGTINFNTKYTKSLINHGYVDTIQRLIRVQNNWVKEKVLNNLSYSDERKEFISAVSTLTAEEKYRLFNECEFLLLGNHAKINYLSEDGFGKMLYNIFSGNGKKVKKKFLENNAELQEKMLVLLSCLDGEMLNLKQVVYCLFDNAIDTTNTLILLHKCVLALANNQKIAANAIDNLQNAVQKLVPDFSRNDLAPIQQQANEIEAIINAQIYKLNAKNKEMAIKQEELIMAENKRIAEAKEYRILRMLPKESTVITSNGTDKAQGIGLDPWWNSQYSNVVEEGAKNNNCTAVIVHEFNKSSIKQICTTDYCMFLWFINTPKEKRKGQYVCMIDRWDTNLFVYEYEVSSDGENYKPIDLQEHTIFSGRTRWNTRGDLKKILGSHYDESLIYRTFYLPDDGNLEDRMNDTRYYTIHKVDPNWENKLFENDGEKFVELVDRFLERVYE